MKICITGGIACGKSLVGGFLQELGVPVRDADDICRELTAPGGELYDRVVAAFGPGIAPGGGGIDRRALGEIVFSDPERRLALNGIVHPAVRRELEAWAAGSDCRETLPLRCVAAVIPLVFEVEWENSWDKIVCVSAPASFQLERLKRRGLSGAAATARIEAQLSLNEKMRRAHYVIFNSGDRECARIQTLKVVHDITGQAEKQNGKET